MEWEVDDGAKVIGPFTEEQILKAIAGTLPATTLIRRVGEAEWRPVGGHLPFAKALEQRERARVAAAGRAPSVAPTPAALMPAWPAQPGRKSAASSRWLLVAGVGVGVFVLTLVIILSSGESKQCRDNIEWAQGSINNGSWDIAEQAVTASKGFCAGYRKADIEALDAKIRAHQAEVAAQKKRTEKDREEQAAGRFPRVAETLRDSLKETDAAIARKDWPTAAPRVKHDRDVLDEFRGTAVEKGDGYLALDLRISKQEEAVQPYLDRIQETIHRAVQLAREQQIADIHAAFRANALAAEKTWGGREVTGRGTVIDVARDDFGDPYVAFGASSGDGWKCVLASNAVESARMLHKGMVVSMKGKVNRWTDSLLLLTDCVPVND